MGKFTDKLSRFMYGRYGADQLYVALFVLYFVVLVINLVNSRSSLGWVP